MKAKSSEEFVQGSIESLTALYDMLHNLQLLKLESIGSKSTALVIVDMINGFVRKGALSSIRVEGIVPEVVRLSELCSENGIRQIAFADAHGEKSPEFSSYPVHCMKGTEESELIDEIKNRKDIKLVHKNSTNGFIEDDFKKWLHVNNDIRNFIVVGDCTDICILQFALSLKTYFNMKNMDSEVIVPTNAVETFELGPHNGDLMNAFALFAMSGSGIRLVSHIE